MDKFTQRKLHEIVESVKEDYLLNVIEESSSDAEVLKTKKFLNETALIIESMLVEEGLGDGMKEILKDAFIEAPRLYFGAMKEGLGAFGKNFIDAYKEIKEIPGDIKKIFTGEMSREPTTTEKVQQKLAQIGANIKSQAIINGRRIKNFSEDALNTMTRGAYSRMTPQQRQLFLTSIGAIPALGAAGYAGYKMAQPEDFMDQVQDTISDLADRASDVVSNIM